jgi:hypothetical protein
MGRIKVKGENKGMTNAKQRFDITQRVGNLEQGFAKLVESVNNSFQQLAQDSTGFNNRIHSFDLFVQAMMEVLDKGGFVTKEDEGKYPDGPKAFSSMTAEVFKRLRIAELEAESEKQLAKLKVMEGEGQITKADTIISENDFIVTSTKDSNGQYKSPTKSVGIVNLYVPAVKELLVNKKVGETLTLPDGNILEILEVYSIGQKSEESQESDDSTPKSVE